MNSGLQKIFVFFVLGVWWELAGGVRPAEASDPVEAALATGENVPARPAALPLPESIVQAERFIGRGEVFSAQLAYQKALLELLSGNAPVPEEQSAVAEALLYKLLDLARQTGENNELAKCLAEAAGREVSPYFALLLNHALAQTALRAGHLATAKAAAERLGVIRDFAVLGPFANERGHAFNADLLAAPLENSAAGKEKSAETAFPSLMASYRGKKQTISWRFFHNEDPLGGLNLAALCRPAQEVLAYVAVFLQCDRETPAALHLGADDTLAVWLNGKKILNRDNDRPAAFAQETLACSLGRGINCLLFKVGQAREKWELLPAITAPGGELLSGVKNVTADALAQKNTLRHFDDNNRNPAKIPVARGACDFLARYLQTNSADPRARYWLTVIQAARGVAGHYAQDLRKQMMQVMRLDAKTAAYPRELARLADERTRFKADRDDNLRRLSLLKVLAAEPADVAALTELGDYYLRAMESPRRAREYADKALAINKFAPDANVLLAEIFLAFDWRERAQVLLAEIRKRHPHHLALNRTWGITCLENGQIAPASAAYNAILAADRLDKDALRAAVSIENRAGRPAAARKLWADYLQLRPHDLEARMAMLKDWLDYADSRDTRGINPPGGFFTHLDKALALAPQEAELYVLRGRALLAAGRREEAEKALVRALELDPGLAAVREYLRFRGHHLPELLTAVPDLGEFSAQCAGQVPPGGKTHGGRGCLYYLSERIDELHADGGKRRGTHDIFRILSQSGAEKARRLPVWYDADNEEVAFVAARVLHNDGSISEAQIVNVPRPGERQVRMAVFPALTKGDVVETAYVVTQRRPDFFGDYFGHIQRFAKNEPVMRARYVLRAPGGKKLYFHTTNGAPQARRTALADGTEWVWEMAEIPPLPEENYAPPRDARTPTVQVSTFRDWNDLARWYWGLVKSQNALSAAISEKVGEITEGCESDKEKIAAIYDWVTTEVRNNAWSFGVHGFKPYNAATIFTRRFGDCKDKATLINVMTRAAGLTAWPVLVRASDYSAGRGEEDLTLPLLAHFNHCISVVETSAGRIFLDGTMRYRTLDGLPFTVSGAQAVIVRADGAERTLTPAQTPDANSWRENATLTWDAEGHADYAFTARARGQASVYLRAWFANDQTWDQVLKSVGTEKYGPVSAAVVNDVGLNPAIEKLAPDETTLDARLRLRDYVKSAGREKVCRLPAPLLSGTFGPDAAIPEKMAEFARFSQREIPVVLPTRLLVERNLRVEFPDGWRLLNVAPRRQWEHPFGTLTVEIAGFEGFAEIHYQLVLRETTVATRDYAAFRRFCLAADRWAAGELRFRKAE